jgi:AAA+ superfamily predicted ATPase
MFCAGYCHVSSVAGATVKLSERSMDGVIITIVCSVSVVVGLLTGLIFSASMRRASSPALFELVRAHFAPASVTAVSVTERQFPARVRADLHRCLERYFSSTSSVANVSGIRNQDSMMFGISLSELLSQETNASTVPLEHEEIDIGEDQPIRCVRNALWLLQSNGTKAAVLLSQVYGFNQPPKTRLDVATEQGESGSIFTRQLFNALEDAVRKADSYRGKVLSLESAEEYTGESSGITVHRIPPVTRAEVILPDTTLKLLERNVLQFVEQRKALVQLGQSAKKGLLFYGPPGNGKTHTIRYLIGELKGHTTLLITAEQVDRLGEYMALARLLQPSIVVVEDVDLIARTREQSGSPCQEGLLNKLLNEMDGLKEDCEIVFVLTTNRPEQLEEALAARPGRVDQGVEFPVPDSDGRAKLVRLYSQAVSLDDTMVDKVVAATEGVSAAFIKELIRRTLQNNLASGNGNGVNGTDIDNALEELIVRGGRLNHKVLGYCLPAESS